MTGSPISEKLQLIKDETKRLSSLVDEANSRLLKFFESSLKDIFAAYPKLKSFAWQQWAPHFNDGAPCYFSVHCDIECIYVDGIMGDADYELDEEELENYGTELTQAERDAIRDLLGDLLVCIPADVLEDKYGHGSVTCYRDGTVKCEYVDHY